MPFAYLREDNYGWLYFSGTILDKCSDHCSFDHERLDRDREQVVRVNNYVDCVFDVWSHTLDFHVSLSSGCSTF